MARPVVVIGLLGTTLDAGASKRWNHWRPSVALCRHDDLVVSRFELLHGIHHRKLAELVATDIVQVSPETEVRLRELPAGDPWDFEEVFATLFDFAHGYPFRPEHEDYLVHITTGTHVAQICLFLLTEARHFPARLVQCSPPDRSREDDPGTYRTIDLDLGSYARIAARFEQEQREGLSFLKQGIDTRNPAFNQLVEQIERVAMRSRSPILLTGPTGAGKTRLARRIYELKRQRGQVEGAFVEVNCATLRGDLAMSMLFGHARGAFTGAVSARQGLLRTADRGVVFLDEIGELGLDEQAMLLRALEDKRFAPLGSDREIGSDFQLIAGTNRELRGAVAEGRFRDDLLARLDLWTFALPGLAARPEDIEPNLDFELERLGLRDNTRLGFAGEARRRFLRFATTEASWPGNFRDFAAAIERMSTLAHGGRITSELVDDEIARLRASTRAPSDPSQASLDDALGAEAAAALDRFDAVQLAEVVRVCKASRSLSAAGRVLFASSRARKATSNDADRLRKYLARFGLHYDQLRG
jgi:transcriptional regulatory protein RtcR